MTTIGDKKKTRERSILEFYLKTVGIAGEIQMRERPDFIVIAGTKSIGVEITEYHQPQHPGDAYPRKVVEAEWEKLRAAVVAYRKTTSALNQLSVVLSFVDLSVPPSRQHLEFIQAVHAAIEGVRAGLSERRTLIRIRNDHPPILRKHLSRIDVREVGCYMEWDWNHMVAAVGTSDDELVGILQPKLGLKRPVGVSELHLVMAGDGSSGASYIGFLSPDWLNTWANLNAALGQTDYDFVAILNYEEGCRWQRSQGWLPMLYQ